MGRRYRLGAIFVGLLDFFLNTSADTIKRDDIYWNTSNPIFRIDNTDHIIDVNKGNLAFEYDQVNIICPVYAPGTHEDDAEKYIIYNVSKEEYDSCRITNPNPRIIAVCDKPNKLMYFTITFRSFTPQPGGLEFRPGQDYYFISTSSRDDLHRRIGGRCSTHNMKVVFKVCCKDDAPEKLKVPQRPVLPAAQPTTNIPPIPWNTSSVSTTTYRTMTSPPAPPPPVVPSIVTTTWRYKDIIFQSSSAKTVTKKSGKFYFLNVLTFDVSHLHFFRRSSFLLVARL
ncbi:hypothetical protein QYM36_007447 [Artemia franciscana]|uniref:Ephrin RBD domain-containing protein n=1 Tax=Artemia franciscana TaxID=6661 RepID=A0AA88IG56_ARTSF|nr:hypothetical protein QYM36_007447 [Artemia franciscana]KAK2726609.1 hypothetical protein QYM36_007447 [Artemia franciscana]